jgi:hypothetical protein
MRVGAHEWLGLGYDPQEQAKPSQPNSMRNGICSNRIYLKP